MIRHKFNPFHSFVAHLGGFAAGGRVLAGWALAHVGDDGRAAGALLEDGGDGSTLVGRRGLLLGLLVVREGAEDGDMLSLAACRGHLRVGLEEMQGLAVLLWKRKED